MNKKHILLVFIVFFCIGWSNDPRVNTPVCTATGSQWKPRIASDGFGGAIIAWEDNRMGNRDIFAQRIDSTGEVKWTVDGIPICTAFMRQTNIDIISDGAKGSILVWQDKRGGNYDIYAQRVDHSGLKLWADNGIALGTAPGHQEYPKIIPDGEGGAIIAFQDRQVPDEMSIIAQRIDPSGNILWSPGGEIIFNLSLTYNFWGDYFDIIPDNSGGAIIISDYIKTVQRINAAGAMQWQAGVGGRGYLMQVAPDGEGGAFISWVEDESPGYYCQYSVFAQHLDSSGQKLWNDDGIMVYQTWVGYVELLYLKMKPDTRGGCLLTYIVSWDCYHLDIQGDDLHVARIGSNGAIQWEKELFGKRKNSQLVPDGTGGVIVTWQDYRENEDGIYAQYINAGGKNEWTADGVRMTTAGEDHRTISDGAGGCISTWEKGEDIYAQNVYDSGALGNCNWPVAVIDADRYGGIAPVTIHFDGSGSFDPDGSISRWYWNFGGDTSSNEKVSRIYPDPGSYEVVLRVKDNSGKWSADTRKQVIILSVNDIDRVVMELEPSRVKASGKGQIAVRAACFTKQTSGLRENDNPIPVDIGFDFTTTSGTWADEVSFSSGVYSRTLISGDVGTATVSAVLDGDVFKSGTVDFVWPLPPANVKVEMKVNRSLLKGEYYANLSWSENPQEFFTPAKYRVYRSTDGGAFELIGEVNATVFSYDEGPLPAGHQYTYAVSMVDSEGDESPAAQETD